MNSAVFNFIDEIDAVNDSLKLKVKIIRLWNQKYHVDMVLLDEKGLMIQAFVKKTLMDSFEMLLEEGGIIIISNFGVAENIPKFAVIKQQYKLNFYTKTLVKKTQDFLGPVNGFRFVSFDDILSGVDPAEFTIDVIGSVIECGNMEVFKRNGKDSKRISLQLENLEGVKVSCTLWDDYAQQFSGFVSGGNIEGSVVIIIQFAKIRSWQGLPSVQNGFFGTRLFINEDIDEINEFKKRLVVQIGADTHLSTQTVYSVREEFLNKYPKKSIDEIPDVKLPEGQKKLIFVLLGTIKFVQKEHGWYYLGCRKCKTKVLRKGESMEDIDIAKNESNDTTFWCKKCKAHVTSVVPRFKICIRVQDETGTGSFVLFEHEVSQIINKSAYEIRETQDKVGDVDSFPVELRALINKKFIFKFEVTDYNIDFNFDVYTVLKLCDDDEIIQDMIKRSAADQDTLTEPEIDRSSIGGLDSKDAVSYTGDSLAATDNDNDCAISPVAKHSRENTDKEMLGENSSTKRKLVKVKIEKP